MRLVILRRLLLVAAVELLFVVVLGLLDLFINFLDDIIHVLPLANLAENVAFELKHGLFDDAVVEVYHIGGDLLAELWVLVHDGLEVLLA